jgi:hypothetical protein
MRVSSFSVQVSAIFATGFSLLASGGKHGINSQQPGTKSHRPERITTAPLKVEHLNRQADIYNTRERSTE